MHDPLSLMIQALEKEIAAVEERGGDIRVELKDGERKEHVEDRWIYRFIVTEDLNLSDDAPVRVIADGEEVEGEIVSFQEGVLLIALAKDFGEKLASIRLIVDTTFLLEVLRKRLQEVQRGEALFSQEAAERVIGQVSPTIDEQEPHATVVADNT